MQKVCSESPEEHLQPFKDKMEAFVLSGERSRSCIFQILNFQEGETLFKQRRFLFFLELVLDEEINLC